MAGPILATLAIAVVIWFLVKKLNAIAVLLFSGLGMLATAYLLGMGMPKIKQPTGSAPFELVEYIVESFQDINLGVGLVIMIISGFVAYMDKIGASDALVYLAMKPLSIFRKYPYVLASMVLPLGQFLFVSIPSAAGLGLLLMATVFPIVVNLGVSRLSVVSIITATTALGIGPASAIAMSAGTVLKKDITLFFFENQVPMTLVLCAVLTVSYFFVNRYFDARHPDTAPTALEKHEAQGKKRAPNVYGILPVLPLVLLLAFSSFVKIWDKPIRVDTNIAMLVGLFVAMAFELVRTRNLTGVLKSLDVFWGGMGDIFKSVVTLIIAADIFSKGLIALGFIDGLLQIAEHAGLGGAGIGIVMTVMIFLASILMGSGNAAFFAFGPLVPSIAGRLGTAPVDMILPMSMASSMGRTVSPIAGVVVACAELAKVPPIDIVKRNAIPFGIALVVMLIFNYI